MLSKHQDCLRPNKTSAFSHSSPDTHRQVTDSSVFSNKIKHLKKNNQCVFFDKLFNLHMQNSLVSKTALSRRQRKKFCSIWRVWQVAQASSICSLCSAKQYSTTGMQLIWPSAKAPILRRCLCLQQRGPAGQRQTDPHGWLASGTYPTERQIPPPSSGANAPMWGYIVGVRPCHAAQVPHLRQMAFKGALSSVSLPAPESLSWIFTL